MIPTVQSKADRGVMEIDHQDLSVSNMMEVEDFEDLFNQHNHYSDNHSFQSDGSCHPSNFSIGLNSDSDIHMVPQFEELEFSDSDGEQEYKEWEGDGMEVDLLDDLLFCDWGSIFSSGNSDENKELDELDDGSLPSTFQEHPVIQDAYICTFLLANLKGSTHD